MDPRKEDADPKTALAPEAPARPAPGAVPSAEPLHGPVDAAEDSLDGFQTAFGALPVEEVVSQPQPVKRKRENESEKDAGGEADEGEEQGQDLTHDPTFEGAPSASSLHASPSPITTTLPATATSTSTTNPPMAQGTGFTGMPPYPAYGMGPPTTALHEATTTSEPVASSSAPRWYSADYPHPLHATGTYVDVPGYAPGYTPGYAPLSGLRRGPQSLGGRSRGSGRSSNRSLTRSEINEVLRGATSKIVGDLTQEIREKLEPVMIPPQTSPISVGMSPHRVQANHLTAGLTNTLGGPGRPTDADSCSCTEKSLRAENGPAALQPRDELDEGRAGPAGANSLEGYGGRRALWL